MHTGSYGQQKESPVTLKDIEENVYKTVKIGNQWWMAENLKTTKFNDNSPIQLSIDKKSWNKRLTPSYCWYEYDSSYKNICGAFYNLSAVITGKLCPSGWHVPSNDDWNTLFVYLGGNEVTSGGVSKTVGGKLKTVDSTLWMSPNVGATNESGFSILPYSFDDGIFKRGKNASFWSSSIKGPWQQSYICHVMSVAYSLSHAALMFFYCNLSDGSCVRCIRD
ncbi:MAG: fibrobacter succinogenes major paralogous domain-containing protein [Ignavibacteria bacterium]